MPNRRYLLALAGTTAVVAIGSGVAAAATGSKTTTTAPSKSAAPRSPTTPTKPTAPRSHTTRRYAPRSGNCPDKGSGSGSSSGAVGPAAPSYGNI